MIEIKGRGCVPVDLVFRAWCPHVASAQYVLRRVEGSRSKMVRGCGRCSSGWCRVTKKECSIDPKMKSIESFYDGVEMRPIKH